MPEAAIPPRRLDDKVLQSAQDAVLIAPLGPTDPQPDICSDFALSQSRRRSYIASHPLAAALAAACGGAMAILALRSVMQSRRHANKVSARQ